MRQIQGHYGGSTWAGATRPYGLPRRLTPRSSLPPTYYQKPEPAPTLDRHEYLIRSCSGTRFGPHQVPPSGHGEYSERAA
jgi:hypothetical protein